MVKKKRKNNPALTGLLGLGLTSVVSVSVLGVLPTNPITPQVTTGVTRFAGFFPTFGRLLGAGLVIGGASQVARVAKDLGKPLKKRRRIR